MQNNNSKSSIKKLIRFWDNRIKNQDNSDINFDHTEEVISIISNKSKSLESPKNEIVKYTKEIDFFINSVLDEKENVISDESDFLLDVPEENSQIPFCASKCETDVDKLKQSCFSTDFFEDYEYMLQYSMYSEDSNKRLNILTLWSRQKATIDFFTKLFCFQ